MIYISVKLGLAPAVTTRISMRVVTAEDFLSIEGEMRKRFSVHKTVYLMALSIVDLPALEVVLHLPYLAKRVVNRMLSGTFFFLYIEGDPYICSTQLRITLFVTNYQ